jgi:hypothetical protein
MLASTAECYGAFDELLPTITIDLGVDPFGEPDQRIPAFELGVIANMCSERGGGGYDEEEQKRKAAEDRLVSGPIHAAAARAKEDKEWADYAFERDYGHLFKEQS